VGKTFHLAIDVEGLLRAPDREVAGLVRINGKPATAHQARQWLRIQEMNGRKVLPCGEACEGFSYETGCPGHPVAEVAHG